MEIPRPGCCEAVAGRLDAIVFETESQERQKGAWCGEMREMRGLRGVLE